MNKLNKTIVALTLAVSSIFSVNASAIETDSIEKDISTMIFAQSKQLITVMSNELEQSIDSEVKAMARTLFNHNASQPLAKAKGSDKNNSVSLDVIAKLEQ